MEMLDVNWANDECGQCYWVIIMYCMFPGAELTLRLKIVFEYLLSLVLLL